MVEVGKWEKVWGWIFEGLCTGNNFVENIWNCGLCLNFLMIGKLVFLESRYLIMNY